MAAAGVAAAAPAVAAADMALTDGADGAAVPETEAPPQEVAASDLGAGVFVVCKIRPKFIQKIIQNHPKIVQNPSKNRPTIVQKSPSNLERVLKDLNKDLF